MKEYIGIFGGAFDPPHLSHISLSKALIKERGYDKLVFLPSHNPPHKKLSATDKQRLEMLEIAVSGRNIEISTVELDMNGVGYTADYLPILIKKYGDNIEYIIGGDSFLKFSKWSRPFEIIKMVKLLVVARDGERQKLLDKLSDYDNIEKKGICIAKYLPESMSSTEARDMLRLHLPVDEMLDEKIIDYIEKNNLYNEYGKYLDKLEKSISEERLAHTKKVVLFALRYAESLGLDYDKVFLACLLHDCAKGIKDFAPYTQLKNGIPKDCVNTPVAHAFCGKFVAERDYKITDEEVLDAICYHTTARPKMTKLDMLVYAADMLEDSRDFEGVDNLRKAFNADFQQGFVQCLTATVEHLQKNNMEIYPLTLQAYDYYKGDKNGLFS